MTKAMVRHRNVVSARPDEHSIFLMVSSTYFNRIAIINHIRNTIRITIRLQSRAVICHRL